MKRDAFSAIRIVRDCEAYVGTAAHVLLLLATYADPDGSNVKPYQKTIARQIGRTTRQVRRYIKQFLADGALEMVQPPAGNYPPEYRLRLDVLDALGRTPMSALDDAGADAGVRPTDAQGGHGRALGRTCTAARADMGVRQTYHLPPRARPPARARGGGRARTCSADGCDERANRIVDGRWYCSRHAT